MSRVIPSNVEESAPLGVIPSNVEESAPSDFSALRELRKDVGADSSTSLGMTRADSSGVRSE
jgi:hypothetical protein